MQERKVFQQTDFFVNDNRFLAIVNAKNPFRPPWIIKAVRAGPMWDARGIDAFVYVRPDHTPKAIKVPVQIMGKSLGVRNSVEAYYERYPLLRGICLFVRVHNGLPDEMILERLWVSLGEIRDSKPDYGPFLREYIQLPESAHGTTKGIIVFRKRYLPEANPWLRR